MKRSTFQGFRQYPGNVRPSSLSNSQNPIPNTRFRSFSRSRSRPRFSTNLNRPLECYYCHCLGHTANNCFRRQNRNFPRRQPNQGRRNFTIRNFRPYTNPRHNESRDSNNNANSQCRVNFSESSHVFGFTLGESSIGIDSVVPTFKETSYPIEEIFQAHTDDVIDSDFSFMDSEPLDIYSRQEIFDEQVQDTVYGTEEEFNTLFYDLDNDSDNDDLENDRSVSQCQSLISLPRTDSKISTFVCTQQNTQSVCLAQVTGKVKRMWVKALFKSEPKVNPQFALDMPIYNKITAISSFSPTVIHASYLHSSPDFYFEDNPEIQLHFDGTVTASTPSGLSIHTLIDTGCHKTLLSKKFYDQNQKHFQNFSEIPFLEKHSITVGNGQQIIAHKMISLPLLIQGHHFEFLALIVDMLDEYDFIIGLEAAIQLEAVYQMTSHIFSVKPRSVLLFPVKDIEISPGTSTSIQLVGDLPCTFSSGPAIIRVQPVQVGYSFNTIEVEFLDQSTCIYVSNKSQKSVYFTKISLLLILISDLLDISIHHKLQNCLAPKHPILM